PRRSDEQQRQQNRSDDRPLQHRPRGNHAEEEDHPPLGEFEEVVRVSRELEESPLQETRARLSAGLDLGLFPLMEVPLLLVGDALAHGEYEEQERQKIVPGAE